MLLHTGSYCGDSVQGCFCLWTVWFTNETLGETLLRLHTLHWLPNTTLVIFPAKNVNVAIFAGIVKWMKVMNRGTTVFPLDNWSYSTVFWIFFGCCFLGWEVSWQSIWLLFPWKEYLFLPCLVLTFASIFVFRILFWYAYVWIYSDWWFTVNLKSVP